MSPSPSVRALLQGLPRASSTNLRDAVLATHVTGVTSDSRDVQPGTMFVAVKGTAQDGHAFIPEVQRAGALLIVGETPPPAELAVPYLQVPDARLALAHLAANFYGHPSHTMTMVGVTGTSGKTTTTYLCEAMLKASGHQVGVLGTVNVRFGAQVYPATHTTPGAVELQGFLARMQADGCTAVVMEVSSHALKQHRSATIAFDAMVFTNLSPEHLDFHPDMEDYYLSKAMLFQEYIDVAIAAGKRPTAVVNADDENGQRLLAELKAAKRSDLRVLAYGLGPGVDVSGSGLAIDLASIRGDVAGVPVQSSLTGRFNASNILAALGVGRGLGLPPQAIAQGIAALPTVPGRLERVPNARGVHILVDYAHKPDALEKVLKTLREVKGSHHLITVFGCGGDRDRLKRPVMGRLAVELSDYVFVTSDNPRTEKPEAIIQEIAQGIVGHTNYTIEPDRRQAIFAAVHQARPGDLVVIAGKGHEDYQILADPAHPQRTVKIHFDDREVAAEALQSV